MRFTENTKLLLLMLSLMLNVVIRIPSLPHSYGVDSFAIRNLANSIPLFGEARYWINVFSIGGFYPYSYASAEPFLLAGTKQLTGLNTEMYPLAFDIVIGSLSFFIGFALAGRIVKSDFYKFIVAIVFSVAPGVLIHTTWSVSTRGLFIVLFPLLLFLLIKTKENPFRYIFLSLIFLLLLSVTHHFFWFTLPIIFGFMFLRTIHFIKPKIHMDSISRNGFKGPLFANMTFIFLFFMAVTVPFLSYFFIKGSKYVWVINLIETNARYSGPLMFFAFAGFGYLVLKNKKDFNEWFILLVILGISPIVYNQTYSHFINIIFISLMIGYAFTNLATSYSIKRRKVFLYTMIFFIASSVLFSSFYQHNRTHIHRSTYDWYMLESTYQAGMWAKDSMPLEGVILGYGSTFNLKPERMIAVAGGLPKFVSGFALDIVYGFIDPNDIKVRKNSPLSTSFYQDNPYIKVEPKWSVAGLINWMMENDQDVDRSGAINKFGVSYIVEDTNRAGAMTRSLHEKKDAVYSNGQIKVWII